MAVDKGVPVGRYYTVIVIVAVTVGLLAYMAGESAGETETKYEASQRDQEKQKEVYTNDLYIEKEKPVSSDYGAWSEWMRNQL